MKRISHIGVYAVIRDGSSLLVVRKSRGPYTGLYDLPGGSLEHGESIEAGLRREVKEETGLDAGDFQGLFNISLSYPFEIDGEMTSLHHIGLVYSGKATGSIIGAMEVEDSLGAEWVDPRTLSSEQVTPILKRVVSDMSVPL